MEDSDSKYLDNPVQETGEIIRKNYLYRRMILSRKVTLSPQGRIRMVGPDCAYHLYASHNGQPSQTKNLRKRK